MRSPVEQASSPVTERPVRAKVSDSYALTDGDPIADQYDILRLWQLLPSEQPPGRSKLEWFYQNSPAGVGTIYFLTYLPENRRVGVVCLGKRNFVCGAQTVSGAVFGDFAIEPAHRSLGPALYFQKEFLKLAQQHYDIVYGFPNVLSGSVRVFAGHKLNATISQLTLPMSANSVVDKMRGPQWLRVVANRIFNVVLRSWVKLRMRRFAKGIARVDAGAEFLDGLWAQAPTLQRPIGIRDAETVNWRLSQCPSRDYKVTGFTNTVGKPIAYLAYRWEPGRVLRVVDYFVGEPASLALALARLVIDVGFNARSVSVKMHAGDTTLLEAVRQLGFIERKRSDHFVSVSDSLPFDADATRLTMFDNDA